MIATTYDLSEMLRRHGHGDVRIPHLEWTVGQCVAHLIISNWQYANQLVGPGAHLRIEQTSEVNDWSVAPFAGLAPAAHVNDLARSTDHVLDVLATLPERAAFTWWSGSQADVEVAIGLLVGERLVHGWDIARACGMRWPIKRHHAVIAMEASFAVMPLLVDPVAAAGLNATFEMRLRGAGRYELRFTDGALTTSRVDRVDDADCRISAHPVAMMLTGFGRVAQWRPVLRGRLIAWGRRPWLGLRLSRVLRSP